MSTQFTWEQARRMRAWRQQLGDACQGASAAAIVRDLFGLQSQEWPSAQLAIHARARELTQADVIYAREDARAFALTWSLRGTLHLVGRRPPLQLVVRTAAIRAQGVATSSSA